MPTARTLLQLNTVSANGPLDFDLGAHTGFPLMSGPGRFALGDAILLGDDHAGLFGVEATLTGPALPATSSAPEFEYNLSNYILTLVSGRLEACCNPPSPAGFERDFSLDPLAISLPETTFGFDPLALFLGNAAFAIPLDIGVAVRGLAPIVIRGDLQFEQVPVPEPGSFALMAFGLIALATRKTRPRC